ncbi:MAG: CAP domain-containing protein [Lactobacillus sp.]
MKKKNLLVIIAAVFSCLALSAQPTYAAKYTKSESKKVKSFQREYRSLSKTKYNRNNIYQQAPNFANPFSPGVLTSAYIPDTMDYINYYRSLFGLPDEANYEKDNLSAQIGAAALASVNAGANLKAHGLLDYMRPNYISEADWDTAESSTLGNINFLDDSRSATAGEIVTDLIREDNNIAGAGNIGHRAIILSTRATRMGIGAAYSPNYDMLYSVEYGLFADDILRAPVKNQVVYPATKVFPYELVGKDTPWSYSTTKRISSVPKIYITDLTKNKKKRYRASQVRNFKTMFYGEGYTTTITYRPGKIKLVNTHKYKVEIGKHYTYTFRFFRQKG